MAELYGMCDNCLEIKDIRLENTASGLIWLCSDCKLKFLKKEPSDPVDPSGALDPVSSK